jgi:hypothetical protein
MPFVAEWEGSLPVLVTEAIVTVKELFTGMSVGDLAPPVEPSCVSTGTRRAPSWDLRVFGYEWFMCLPEKSSCPR